MMRKITYIATVFSCALLSWSCFDVEEENFRTLAPISFNDVLATIDVSLGEELVYDKLQVKSETPVTNGPMANARTIPRTNMPWRASR
jgi:hypothetical protein